MRIFAAPAAAAFIGTLTSMVAYKSYSSLNQKTNTTSPEQQAFFNNTNDVAFAAPKPQQGQQTNCTEEGHNTEKAGHWIDGLPEYSIEQVDKMNGGDGLDDETRVNKPTKKIWIMFRSGVYDITKFVPDHPGGGMRLLMAAGSTIEPFWKQFTIHDQAEVFKLLESFRIGNVKGTKGQTFEPLKNPNPKSDNKSNIVWENEPTRDPAIIAHTLHPFNGEAPASVLSKGGVTPNTHFFVRNHLPVPLIDVDDADDEFCLEVSGLNMKENVCDKFHDLMKKFSEKSVTTTIQCGGNRRSEAVRAFTPEGRSVKGTKWASGAISTASWAGASLREVLLSNSKDTAALQAMADSGKYHVHFGGADEDSFANFEVSVPLGMVMNPEREALVAWKMNGDKIPRDHGFPLRAIVPGTVGVRNCKWLRYMRVADHESKCDWQQRDYKSFPEWENDVKNAAKYPTVYEMPVQSAITDSSASSCKKQQTIHKKGNIKGFAYSGAGREVQRVEVSLDGGKTFSAAANLSDGGIHQQRGRRWAWKKFDAEFELPSTSASGKNHGGDDEKTTVCVRALTESGDIQPPRAPYNFRGLFFNSYSCVDF